MKAAIGVVILAGVVALNLLLPDCLGSEHMDQFVEGMSVTTFMLVGATALVQAWCRKEKRQLVLVLPLVVISAMVASERAHRARGLSMAFSDRVTEKFRSRNHGAFSVRFASYGVVEFVHEDFWEVIRVGDHVEKMKCSNSATINGEQRVQIVY